MLWLSFSEKGEVGQENLEEEKEGIPYHLYFEVVICEFGEEVIARLCLLAVLEVC